MRKYIIFILLLIGTGFGAFFFGKNTGAEKAQSLLAQELPMEHAIRGVEVSVWKTSNALYYYMVRLSKTSLEEYRHQLADVNEFMTKYKNLLETDEEKAVAPKVVS